MARHGATIPEQSFERAIAITLSDATTYSNPDETGSIAPFIPEAFFVGVAGDVTILDMGGNTTLLKNCQAGVRYNIRCRQFRVTGTTATNLVALYF